MKDFTWHMNSISSELGHKYCNTPEEKAYLFTLQRVSQALPHYFSTLISGLNQLCVQSRERLIITLGRFVRKKPSGNLSDRSPKKFTWGILMHWCSKGWSVSEDLRTDPHRMCTLLFHHCAMTKLWSFIKWAHPGTFCWISNSNNTMERCNGPRVRALLSRMYVYSNTFRYRGIAQGLTRNFPNKNRISQKEKKE